MDGCGVERMDGTQNGVGARIRGECQNTEKFGAIENL